MAFRLELPSPGRLGYTCFYCSACPRLLLETHYFLFFLWEALLFFIHSSISIMWPYLYRLYIYPKSLFSPPISSLFSRVEDTICLHNTTNNSPQIYHTLLSTCSTNQRALGRRTLMWRRSFIGSKLGIKLNIPGSWLPSTFFLPKKTSSNQLDFEYTPSLILRIRDRSSQQN